MDRYSKNYRSLDMYIRLCEGRAVNKTEEARRFGVDGRSIQRDIDDIRACLAERSMNDPAEKRTVRYDRIQKGYVLQGLEDTQLGNSEILAISKILLESRAFTRGEINGILDKLMAGCVSQKNRKLVSELVSNEKYHYAELHHGSSVLDRLWELGNSVKECESLEITYEKQMPERGIVERQVEPVSLLFSEYYFYLTAYIVEKNGDGYGRKYDYPAVFRVDRILDCRKAGRKFRVPYMDRFQEGEFRRRVPFMFAGELMRVRFKYDGTSIDAIMDRLPTAKILSEKKGGYIIEAEVFGKGILMWLLGQKDTVEIMEPLSLREEMKEILSRMLDRYTDDMGREGNDDSGCYKT